MFKRKSSYVGYKHLSNITKTKLKALMLRRTAKTEEKGRITAGDGGWGVEMSKVLRHNAHHQHNQLTLLELQ